MKEISLDDITSLCKRRGFIFQGSEVYGGLSGTWDYGPLGVLLKKNIQNIWWKMFVEQMDNMYGVDAAILMNQKVWQASGHVATFTDPLVECLKCKKRLRTDKLINEDDYKNYSKEWRSQKLNSLIENDNTIRSLNRNPIPESIDSEEAYNRGSDSIKEDRSKSKYYLGACPRNYLNNKKVKCPNYGESG